MRCELVDSQGRTIYYFNMPDHSREAELIERFEHLKDAFSLEKAVGMVEGRIFHVMGQ